jgi:hypothetical protein
MVSWLVSWLFQELADELCSELVLGILQNSRCEKLIDEAGENLGTQKKGNTSQWKPLLSNGSRDVSVDTTGCVMANCRV